MFLYDFDAEETNLCEEDDEDEDEDEDEEPKSSTEQKEAAMVKELRSKYPGLIGKYQLNVSDTAADQLRLYELLKVEYPNTSYAHGACHTINRVLYRIGQIPKVAALVQQHTDIVRWFKTHKKQRRLLKRFSDLDLFFGNDCRYGFYFWMILRNVRLAAELQNCVKCKEYKEADLKNDVMSALVQDRGFWEDTVVVVLGVWPWLRLIKICDSDGPTMSVLYHELQKIDKEYKQIFENSRVRTEETSVELIKNVSNFFSFHSLAS